MKILQLTDEEIDLLLNAVEHMEEIFLDMSNEPEDENDVLATRLSALENEVIWQQKVGGRRPVQK